MFNELFAFVLFIAIATIVILTSKPEPDKEWEEIDKE